MKILQVIEELQAIAKERGNVECFAPRLVSLNAYRPVTEVEVVWAGPHEYRVLLNTEPV